MPTSKYCHILQVAEFNFLQICMLVSNTDMEYFLICCTEVACCSQSKMPKTDMRCWQAYHFTGSKKYDVQNE